MDGFHQTRAPRRKLTGCFGDDPAVDRDDQPSVLGFGQKVGWEQQSTLRMLPPDERLETSIIGW
jgi:hypothetical protein